MVLFRKTKHLLLANMSSSGTGTMPEELQTYWFAFIFYSVKRLTLGSSESGLNLWQILRATKLNLIDFFKEFPQFILRVGPVLRNLYGADWENRLEVHMSSPNVEQFIDLLIRLPAEGYGNSLAYVMSEWTKQQGEIQGSYQIKVTTSELAMLLSTRHAELANIYVQGHLIRSTTGITTRSKAKLAPDQWTVMPLPAKILALLADMLIEIKEQSLVGDDEDSDWEEVQGGDCASNQDFLYSASASSHGRPSPEHLDAIAKVFNEVQGPRKSCTRTTSMLTVTLFGRVADNFRTSAREKGFQVRDFEYSPEAQENRKQDVERLLQDQETLRSSLLQWCYSCYGEVVDAYTLIGMIFLKKYKISLCSY